MLGVDDPLHHRCTSFVLHVRFNDCALLLVGYLDRLPSLFFELWYRSIDGAIPSLELLHPSCRHLHPVGDHTVGEFMTLLPTYHPSDLR
jgi:hypothetical protein